MIINVDWVSILCKIIADKSDIIHVSPDIFQNDNAFVTLAVNLPKTPPKKKKNK